MEWWPRPGEGGAGSRCLTGTEFQLEKLGEFRGWAVLTVTQGVDVLNPTEMYTSKWLKR